MKLKIEIEVDIELGDAHEYTDDLPNELVQAISDNTDLPKHVFYMDYFEIKSVEKLS